ncbi:hypothetical protein L226DRAFT_248319 [Lentinus tigrinus ALCF2SS1-7]|uniref:uncharacterized protein n=1 Tax=Lentinus tigrinus ALCF2SS1-7 TaxID=1328758 RepID=UPI0011661E54|nr:hypothetical protein L226DRAFT_248319 [Lentinus tigrinus ALCF2SS1-7]
MSCVCMLLVCVLCRVRVRVYRTHSPLFPSYARMPPCTSHLRNSVSSSAVGTWGRGERCTIPDGGLGSDGLHFHSILSIAIGAIDRYDLHLIPSITSPSDIDVSDRHRAARDELFPSTRKLAGRARLEWKVVQFASRTVPPRAADHGTEMQSAIAPSTSYILQRNISPTVACNALATCT